MRVFTGGIATETNTFAPMPTGLASFRDRCYFPAGKHPDHFNFYAGPTWAARLRSKELGWDLREGLVAFAQPSGTTTRAAYESLRGELLEDLRAAMPVDMAVLGLHGAMVAEGYEDCEGDLLREVRRIVGPDVVVGAELDPHCHLTSTDGDAARAKVLARRLADELIGMREQLSPRYPTIDQALDEALAFEGGTVVISDGADNAGGGAASDATFFLRRMVERGVHDAAIGPFWDPVAARVAAEAGEGARLTLRMGGKVSKLSGDPIDLVCTVERVSQDHMQTGLAQTPTAMGVSALVACGGIDILLCSIRNQALGTDLFTGIGCDLAARKIVVVKSSQHFHASYSKLAGLVLYAAGPGSVTNDWTTLSYSRIRRPKWPLDDHPLHGR